MDNDQNRKHNDDACIASSILNDENSRWNVLEDDKTTPKNKSTPSAGAALSQLEDLVQRPQDGVEECRDKLRSQFFNHHHRHSSHHRASSRSSAKFRASHAYKYYSDRIYF